MYKYNQDTGEFPKVNDYVEVVNSGSNYDGIRGVFGGWGDNGSLIGLVLLDNPLYGQFIVSWPVVCLKKIDK